MKKIRVLTEKNIINTMQRLSEALLEKQGHLRNVTVLLTLQQYDELCVMSKEKRPLVGTYYKIPYEVKPTEEEDKQLNQDLPILDGMTIEEDKEGYYNGDWNY